jgi:hypothetical protein
MAVRLRVVVFTVALGAVLAPVVVPFAVGEQDRICVAALDGWGRERAHPSSADFDAFSMAGDPATATVAMATPGAQRVIDWINWNGGPGACLGEAHDRMLLTGIGVGIILLGGILTAYRSRSRPEPGSRSSSTDTPMASSTRRPRLRV